MQSPRALLLCAALLSSQGLFGQSLSGRGAPGFSLPDAKQVLRSNLDYRGRWLILDFMRTDSGRCKALSKTLEDVKAKYGSKIEVLAIVTTPDNAATVGRYVAENHITYPVLFDLSEVTATYFQAAPTRTGYDTPHWFAVDPSGTIRYDWAQNAADGSEWVKQLDQLITCAAPVAKISTSSAGAPVVEYTCPVSPQTWAAPAPSADYLNKAARAGNLKQVQEFIAGGAPVNSRDALGGSPLHDAAWAGEKEVAAYLIQMGADVNARHAEGGSTPLHYAVLTNHPEVVEVLLDHGADLAALYKTSQTALHLAAARGYARCATLLIAHGADVNVRDETGATPLSEASWTGEAEMVRLLISKGANVNDVNPQTGSTPLHAAASRGYREVAKALLGAGAHADVRDKSGATPLYLALQFQRMEVVDLLVRDDGGNLPKPHALDVKAVLRDEVLRGQTNVVVMLLDRMPPLGSTTLVHDAALKGHVEILELLLAHGADVNSLNAQGATALHDAALAGQRAAAEALLKHGANIDARDSESGATPLHQAASWGRRGVVELLLARHADPRLKDKNGRTALDLALANGQTEVAEVLKRTP